LIVDDFLFSVIIVGLGVAVVYLKAEYALHLRSKTAERSKQLTLHELHSSRVRSERSGIPAVHVRIARKPTQAQLFGTIRFSTRHSHSSPDRRAN
jgi:hypothetical protein